MIFLSLYLFTFQRKFANIMHKSHGKYNSRLFDEIY